MTQEQKRELLLKDLCSRLPYGVKASYYGAEEECECWDVIESIMNNGFVDIGQYELPIEAVKPYLFPLSNMTKMQKNSFPFSHSVLEALIDGALYFAEDECITLTDMIDIIQWCYENHFDINGLIEKGLAIDATGKNIY